MAVVCAEKLSFSYSDGRCLLENVDLYLSDGWYGLVGANGMGKTTLVKLIAQELLPSAGRIWLEPTPAVVAVCLQELNQLSTAIAQFAQKQDRESCRQRGLLGLESSTLRRFSSLSPGERQRWQLAAALALHPDVLLVDEPTNHLDAEGRDYLVRALKQFRGVGIAISHDRNLLEALTQNTIRIHNAQVTTCPTSYSMARKQWDIEAGRTALQRQELSLRLKRLQDRIQKTRCDLQAARKQRSARARMKTIHDHDGSSAVTTKRAADGEASIGRRLKVLSAELARASQEIPDYVVDKTIGQSVFVGYQSAPKRRILGVDGEDIHAGERLILHRVTVALERHARVHLVGRNGAGKTTLLRSLMSRSTAAPEQLLYLPQELTPGEVRDLTTNVLALEPKSKGRILSLLAALGVDPNRVLGSVLCSPGEARKLKLAFGLATHVWALVLDEPTNHLDLPAIERLEEALTAYPGALLIVSHDSTFARNCTNSVWEIREGQLVT